MLCLAGDCVCVRGNRAEHAPVAMLREGGQAPTCATEEPARLMRMDPWEELMRGVRRVSSDCAPLLGDDRFRLVGGESSPPGISGASTSPSRLLLRITWPQWLLLSVCLLVGGNWRD